MNHQETNRHIIVLLILLLILQIYNNTIDAILEINNSSHNSNNSISNSSNNIGRHRLKALKLIIDRMIISDHITNIQQLAQLHQQRHILLRIPQATNLQLPIDILRLHIQVLGPMIPLNVLN